MPALSHAAPQHSFGFDRSGVAPLGERVADLARRLWPHKTAPNLAARMGKSVRAAELVLSRTGGMSGEALAELLRSDIGFQVLEEVVGDAKPSWWPSFVRAKRLADLERQAADVARSLAVLRQESQG